MAASAWVPYNSARRFLGDGTIDLDTDTFMVNLYTHLSNADDLAAEVLGELVAQVASGHGYLSAGIALTGVTWDATVDPAIMKFTANPVSWNASGGDIEDVMYAVLSKYSSTASAKKLLCYSQLDATQFNVTSGNALRISINANGIFTLS
jgi:hypothetical protein